MIDQRITYGDLKGLETILRTKGTNNRTAAKPGKPRPKPTYINGNVIDLHPYLTDEFWKIKTETDDETDDDSSRIKLKKETLMASAPHPDENWIGLWQELDAKGFVPKSIRTLLEFKNWFHNQDFDIPLYSAGGRVDSKKSGLASLAESAVASDLLKKVISGKVALQFSPPHIQRGLK